MPNVFYAEFVVFELNWHPQPTFYVGIYCLSKIYFSVLIHTIPSSFFLCFSLSTLSHSAIHM